MNLKKRKDRSYSKSKRKEGKVPTKKMAQGEYASIEDSSQGNQPKNTDEVVGTA
jgi:hypothetical protein